MLKSCFWERVQPVQHPEVSREPLPPVLSGGCTAGQTLRKLQPFGGRAAYSDMVSHTPSDTCHFCCMSTIYTFGSPRSGVIVFLVSLFSCSVLSATQVCLYSKRKQHQTAPSTWHWVQSTCCPLRKAGPDAHKPSTCPRYQCCLHRASSRSSWAAQYLPSCW